jgi:hypothetical protein
MSRHTRILDAGDEYSIFVPYRVGDKIEFWMDDDQKVHKGEVLKVNLVLSAGNVEVWYEVETLFRRRKTCAMIDETDILT